MVFGNRKVFGDKVIYFIICVTLGSKYVKKNKNSNSGWLIKFRFYVPMGLATGPGSFHVWEA